MTTQLSDNFTLEEATLSQTASRLGISNIPTPDIEQVMRKTAVAMERIRALLGKPVHINSWYRCPQVNAAIGSNNTTSQHPKGEAVDFIAPTYGTPYEICKLLIDNADLIRFDQLIYEHTWVHVSFTANPRNQVLTLMPNKTYSHGLQVK